jgi:hypothetical protein
MMKRILLFVATLCIGSISAQEFVQVSYGQSYKNQAYYRLSDDAVEILDNNSWDIAFSTFNDGAGIHLNESSVTFGAEAALFPAPTNNFDDPINSANLSGRLYNDEKSWDFGAFNSTRNPNDPNDFGWGTLDAGTGVIAGDEVFALRFKDGSYKKIQIVSLAQGVYTVKYADLDGSNENTVTIDKADFSDTDFAFLSLASGQTLPPIAIDWDLAFVRYAAPNDDGAGGVIQIMSSGVLSAPGVEVAQADNVIIEEVEYEDYIDSLSSEIDVIGWDWKLFNNVSWELAENRAYFVKTADGAVWKLVFEEFGGSSTGNAVFTKELVLSTGTKAESAFSQVNIFPNPAAGDATLLFSLKNAGMARLLVSNALGQAVWTGSFSAQAGLNAAILPLDGLRAGHYLVNIGLDGEYFSEKIVKH